MGQLSEDPPTLVGIDHGFSMPLRYFEAHHLPLDWPACLGCSICVGTAATGSTAGPSTAGGRLSCQRGSSRNPPDSRSGYQQLDVGGRFEELIPLDSRAVAISLGLVRGGLWRVIWRAS